MITKCKEDLYNLLKMKRAHVQSNRSRYFIPNGKQEEFLKSDAFVNILSAGNGIGKTADAINIVINAIYGPQSKWFDLPFYRDHKRPVRARIMSDATVVEQKIVPELKKWLPKGTYTAVKARRSYDSQFTITSGIGKGSFIDILTYSQDPSEFEAVELDLVIADEPMPRELFTPTIRAFRFGGTFFITVTPLKGSGFLFEELEEIESSKTVHLKRKRRSIIYGSTWDNCKCCGTRGILEHSDIEQMVAEYSDEEKDARVYGKPMYLMGAVYKHFCDVHIVRPFRIPERVTRYMSIDPHDAKPTAIIWAFVNEVGEMYIYREMAIDKPIPEIVKEIKTVENNEIIQRRIMDAYFGNKPYGNTKQTVKECYSAAGREIGYKMYFLDGPKGPGSIEAGHELVRNRLYYDKTKEIDPVNCPSLFVFDNCKNVIKSFRNYGYVDRAPKAKEVHGMSAKLGEKWKDFPDCVRFIVQSKARYIKTQDSIINEKLINPVHIVGGTNII